MVDLVFPSNKRPEKARLNRFLRIPLVSAAMIKAFFGGNVCNINNEIKAYKLDQNRSKL